MKLPPKHRKRQLLQPGGLPFPAAKPRKAVPHAFVLESLDSLSPWTRPMFGCIAVYVAEKIVLVLRDKPAYPEDNGVWLATSREHHQSLRRDFPNMRSIRALGEPETSWQVLAADSADFEEAAQRACELILKGDARIGKVPASRKGGARKSARASQATGRAKSPDKKVRRKRPATR